MYEDLIQEIPADVVENEVGKIDIQDILNDWPFEESEEEFFYEGPEVYIR